MTSILPPEIRRTIDEPPAGPGGGGLPSVVFPPAANAPPLFSNSMLPLLITSIVASPLFGLSPGVFPALKKALFRTTTGPPIGRPVVPIERFADHGVLASCSPPRALI